MFSLRLFQMTTNWTSHWMGKLISEFHFKNSFSFHYNGLEKV